MPRYRVAVERKYTDVSLLYIDAPTEEAAYNVALGRAPQTVYDDPPNVSPEAFQMEVIDILPDD